LALPPLITGFVYLLSTATGAGLAHKCRKQLREYRVWKNHEASLSPEDRKRRQEEGALFEIEREAARAKAAAKEKAKCETKLAAWHAETDLVKKTLLYDRMDPACKAHRAAQPDESGAAE
jgi:hypothetical protein